MSAYKKIKCTLVNKSILIKALNELGLKHEVFESPNQLEGYEGSLRKEKAEIIVRRKDLNASFTGSSNDLGFAWSESEKQYNLIISDYDSPQVLNRIKQSYAKIAILEALKAQKFTIGNVTGDLKTRTRNKVTLSATKMV